jgi:trk system potassium uptake protein
MVRVVPVLHVLSFVVLFLGVTMVVPLGVALFGADGAAGSFIRAIGCTVIAGLITLFLTRRGKGVEMQPRDGFLLVALVWTVVPAFATLPLLFSLNELSVTDAYFETVSGLTTTGATVLSGLDTLPYSINFWRMFLVWIGGMGVVVLAVAILPLLGVGGSQVFKAETPGPMKDTKLTPRITQTAKGLWIVYGLLTLACILAFLWAGMPFHDAVVHSFSTMGLGGFSSHDDSFGYFNSPIIEAVTIVFMLIAGINFGTHFLFLRSGRLNVYRRDPEAIPFVALLLASCVGIALFLWGQGTYQEFWTALRYASFNVVSIATTTGFASTDYNKWPIFAPVWMLFLCCFATCSGSTGGGIKLIRAQLMFHQVMREMTRIVHPRASIPVKLAGQVVENNIIFAVLAFMLMYGGTVIVFTMILAATGLDIISSFTAVIVCINNTGPGLEQVGPSTTFAVLTDLQTWVCTFAMLLGRLELFTLFVVLTPGFWRR